MRRMVYAGHPQAGVIGRDDSAGEFKRHDRRLAIAGDDEHGAPVRRSGHQLPVDDHHAQRHAGGRAEVPPVHPRQGLIACGDDAGGLEARDHVGGQRGADLQRWVRRIYQQDVSGGRAGAGADALPVIRHAGRQRRCGHPRGDDDDDQLVRILSEKGLVARGTQQVDAHAGQVVGQLVDSHRPDVRMRDRWQPPLRVASLPQVDHDATRRGLGAVCDRPIQLNEDPADLALGFPGDVSDMDNRRVGRGHLRDKQDGGEQNEE